MVKKDGIGWVIYCDVCGRKVGSFYGRENEEETKELCDVYQMNGEDVCWKCIKLLRR